MLSILIPCYNYDCYDLVEHLHEQCNNLNIDFEILVSEDGGDNFLDINAKINTLHSATYIANRTNLGRAGNINRLLERVKYNAKLILDCDLKPKDKYFIRNYSDLIKADEPLVCFGGIMYEELKTKHSLRYNYGIRRESNLAKEQLKHLT